MQVEDHYIYALREVGVSDLEAGKRQEKSTTQYIAVLYTNLFQKAIEPSELQEMESAMAAIGDKELAKRMLIGTFLRKGDAQVPNMEEMRHDVPTFIQETYIRFFVREPSQAELIFLQNFIESRPQLEPHIIYTTFALSDEYQFY
ncbi:MAG: hypothetical protein AAF696_24190 [Bacteroidota bacterium]